MRRTCATCMHWRPHILYPYIGFCNIHSTLTFDDHHCDKYEPIKINGRAQLYWCQTCRTRLSPEEAKAHIARGDRVYIGGYIDPDVREEIYDSF